MKNGSLKKFDTFNQTFLITQDRVLIRYLGLFRESGQNDSDDVSNNSAAAEWHGSADDVGGSARDGGVRERAEKKPGEDSDVTDTLDELTSSATQCHVMVCAE